MSILIVAAVVCGIFAAVIASAKNRSGGGWFVLGSLFSLPALIAIAAIPALPVERLDARPRPRTAGTATKDKIMTVVGAVFLIVVGSGLTMIAVFY